MTPKTIAWQVPLSVEFSRQESWSGLPFPPPGDLSHPGTELVSPVSPASQWTLDLLSHWESPNNYKHCDFYEGEISLTTRTVWTSFVSLESTTWILTPSKTFGNDSVGADISHFNTAGRFQGDGHARLFCFALTLRQGKTWYCSLVWFWKGPQISRLDWFSGITAPGHMK